MFHTNRGWKKIDLEGAGLQALNLHLARRMKRRGIAYAFWLLFPLGGHRFYLEERIGGFAYLGATLLSLLLGTFMQTPAAFAPLLAACGFALYDLAWIDRRVTALNKCIRMELYLTRGAIPPAGYRGRQTDNDYLDEYIGFKESEKTGAQSAEPGVPAPSATKRVPSLAEQEALLRELSKAKRKRGR